MSEKQMNEYKQRVWDAEDALKKYKEGENEGINRVLNVLIFLFYGTFLLILLFYSAVTFLRGGLW